MAVATAATKATGMIVLREEPLNCETSIAELKGGVVMPAARFYVRNHYPAPRIDPVAYRLRLGGLVRRPLCLGLRDLVSRPARIQEVTLECAGNGRSFLDPVADGEQWGLGAVSSAEWTGLPLASLLAESGIREGATEVVFRGGDGDGRTRFERSLSVAEALSSKALIAYAMNGEPLPVAHGFPVRLVVPGWYGVAAVKWLTEIEVIDHDFAGRFQTDRYQYEFEPGGRAAREPVREQRVRALITEPAAKETLPSGRLAIRGLAWSGAGAVVKVEVSVEHGPWSPARLISERRGLAWRRWELVRKVAPGAAVSVRARATDEKGHVQPEKAVWNRLGYGNNSIQEVAVRVL